MNVAAFLNKTALTYGGHAALARGKRTVMTYAEFAEASRRLGGALTGEFGFKPGDRVALAMTNCPEFMVVLFACWQAGLTAVPINAKLHRRDFEFILENSGARYCFVNADKEETLAAVLAYLHDTYGPGGSNALWVAPSDEIYSYLRLRETTTITRNN